MLPLKSPANYLAMSETDEKLPIGVDMIDMAQ
jgi:hypothetical protein